jgi:hypothetical protein
VESALLQNQEANLFQQVDHHAAEQLGIEVGAFGWHAFAVFADLFHVLNGGGHDKAGELEAAARTHLSGGVAAGGVAFAKGFGDFRLHDGLVDFQVIELNGDAFQLIGHGKVEYAADSAGTLNLDFYSLADDQFLGGLSRVPIVKGLFDNWLQVRVTGTINQPQVARLPGNPAQSVRGLMSDIEKTFAQLNVR